MHCLMPAEGVGIFVYDKRGTGNSAGYVAMRRDFIRDGKPSGPWGDSVAVRKGEAARVR